MTEKVLHIILLMILVLLLTACGVWVNWWNQPLGEVLTFPTSTSEPTMTSIAVQRTEKTPTTVTTPDPTPISSPEPTESPEPVEDKPKPMYILAAGIASTGSDYRYGLADAIRIVRIDFEIPRVSVLTLPRDLWVELPGIKKEYKTLTHGKLNTAYSYGTPAMNRYQGEGGGPGLLAHTIAHNYGLVVDHYVIIDMDVFIEIVDALGGIDIYLHRTWDGRADTSNDDYLEWVFEEGQHHMKGEEALRFARIRLNDTEIMRTDNQTAVLCAIKNKALQSQVLTALPDLVNAFHGKIQTDFSPAQISQMVTLLPKLSPENLLFVRFPNSLMVPGRVFDPSLNNTTFIWDIPIEDIRDFIRDFENDTITTDIGGGGGRLCP
ncbi:MAG: LCP family protein [Anaerolineaceae bacterium]